MTAITSHRPLKDCTPDIARNQIRARASWEDAFEAIVYFGESSPALDGDKVSWIDCEPFPRIKTMVQAAARIPGWSALINSDIVVGEYLTVVEEKLHEIGAASCMSRRYEFDPENENLKNKVVDLGLDFFAATQGTWRKAVTEIPEVFRIGQQQWDTWMLGFLVSQKRCWDITNACCIFHPKHEDRNRMPMKTYSDKYINLCLFPPALP